MQVVADTGREAVQQHEIDDEGVTVEALDVALQAAADDDEEALERALADCVEPWRSRVAYRLD